MSSILLWLVFAYSDCSVSAPISRNIGDVQTVSWVTEPNTRGTFRLLVSCIVTLTLCVYTAVHLNIEPKGTKKSMTYLHKAKWVAIGLLAPELVVYTAWEQRNCACELTKVVNNFITERNKTSPNNKIDPKNGWTQVHSFYTVMGGFVFDTDDINEEQYIPGSPRLTVTPKGMKFLAEIGHIPDIPKDAISDKSKADLLAKSLVCLQAGWMIVQCITRKASRLPLTFLEINTLGHVICALVMYYLWLDKPLDVRDPTPISASWKRPLCAIMFMSSKASKSLSQRQIRGDYSLGEMAILQFCKNKGSSVGVATLDLSRSDGPPTTTDMISPLENLHDQRSFRNSNVKIYDSGESILELKTNVMSVENQDGATEGMTNVTATHDDQRYRVIPISNYSDDADREIWLSAISCTELPPSDSTVVTLRKGQTLANTGIGPDARKIKDRIHYMSKTKLESVVGKNVPIPDSTIFSDGSVRVRPPPVIHLDGIDVVRWELASKALKAYPTGLTLEDSRSLTESKFYVSLRMTNFQDDGLLDYFSVKAFIVLSFATVAYGGLHLAAWNAFFPSYAEHLMWKISGLIVMGSGFLWGLTIPLEQRYHILDLLGDGNVGDIAVLVGLVISLVTYAAARIFLLVEAFISIRKLPVEVYELPQWTVWTQFIPHL